MIKKKNLFRMNKGAQFFRAPYHYFSKFVPNVTFMKYDKINPQLFKDNRSRFIKHLKPNALAVFNANDVMPTNADGTMKFIQNKDLFYLSSVDQEESKLLVFPDAFDPNHREILFLKETNATIARWEGAKLSKEEATENSGVATVMWLQDFEAVFKNLMSQVDYIYLNSNEHLRNSSEVETRDDRFRKWCKDNYPLHKYERSEPIMHHLRSVKSDVEIDLLQKASDINALAFNRVLRFIKPGVM